MISIASIGTLILGSSGIGKSEITLELLSRGHKLISDDAVKLHHHKNTVIASAPHPACQHLHLRDIGCINPNDHFGKMSTITKNKVMLVVELIPTRKPTQTQSLSLNLSHITMLEIALPLCSLTTQSVCSLALKLETLVKQFKLLNNLSAKESCLS